MTRSPGFHLSTPAPTAFTTPASSLPGEKGSGGLNWYLFWMMSTSGKFRLAALTLTTTSPGPGSGAVSSSSESDSGGPYCLQTIAFIDIECHMPTTNTEGRLTAEKRGALGWIIFDHPARKNAINGAMWRGIPAAMERFERDPEVGCVIFRGAGTEAFAAGADISEFEKVRSARGGIAEYDDLLDRVLHSIQDARKPSLAMIYGYCIGGGLEIALACDLRYCAESAQFGIPAAKLGLAYNVEGHKRLIETVGPARTREIMFLGRRYPAEEAFQFGLVHRVLPDVELEKFTMQILATLAQNAPLSIANTKTIIE